MTAIDVALEKVRALHLDELHRLQAQVCNLETEIADLPVPKERYFSEQDTAGCRNWYGEVPFDCARFAKFQQQEEAEGSTSQSVEIQKLRKGRSLESHAMTSKILGYIHKKVPPKLINMAKSYSDKTDKDLIKQAITREQSEDEKVNAGGEDSFTFSQHCWTQDASSSFQIGETAYMDVDTFVPRSEWQTSHFKTINSKVSKTLSMQAKFVLSPLNSLESTPTCVYSKPSSTWRSLWNLAALSIMIFDLMTIPMQVFDPPSPLALEVLGWVAQLFWNLDLVLNFFVGYYKNGMLVMKPEKIAVRYLQTWFAVDLAIVSVDWYVRLSQGLAGYSRLGKTLRLFRTVRLLRVTKFGANVKNLQQRIMLETTHIHFQILKLLVRIVVLNHLVACAWYALGSHHIPNGQSWVIANNVNDKPFLYRYSISLHWALAQLGMGTIEVTPINTEERIFAVLSLLFAIVEFSSLLSAVTNLLTSLNALRIDEQRQRWLLSRFLAEQKISSDLSVRIVRFLKYRYARTLQSLSPNDVSILQLLSPPLHAELQYERYAETLHSHPFFHTLLQSDYFHATRARSSNAVYMICSKTITRVALACEDVLFCCGDVASHMHCVFEGKFCYIQGTQTEIVRPYWWISEAILWTSWVHVGDFQAIRESQVASFDAVSMCEVTSKYPEAWHLARDYAEKFVDDLNNIEVEDLSDLRTIKFENAQWRSRSNLSLLSFRRCCAMFSVPKR